jgi:hypothetical protein
MNLCKFTNCTKPVKSTGLCNGHYLQQWSGKQLTELSGRSPQAVASSCSIDGCDTHVRAKGLCNKHWLRQYKHGDTSTVKSVWGPNNGRWKEVPSYARAHTRIKRRRGAAKRYSCVSCESKAAEWSYDHKCPNELWQDGRPYSADIDRYQPMCKSCHKFLDNRVGANLKP